MTTLRVVIKAFLAGIAASLLCSALLAASLRDIGMLVAMMIWPSALFVMGDTPGISRNQAALLLCCSVIINGLLYAFVAFILRILQAALVGQTAKQ